MKLIMSNEKKWVCPYCNAGFPENLRAVVKIEESWTVKLNETGLLEYDECETSGLSGFGDCYFCRSCAERLGITSKSLIAGFKTGYMERESMLNFDEKFGACNWCANDVTEQAEGEVEITRLEALELLRKYGKRLDSCGIEDGWIIISDMLQEFKTAL